MYKEKTILARKYKLETYHIRHKNTEMCAYPLTYVAKLGLKKKSTKHIISASNKNVIYPDFKK